MSPETKLSIRTLAEILSARWCINAVTLRGFLLAHGKSITELGWQYVNQRTVPDSFWLYLHEGRKP